MAEGKSRTEPLVAPGLGVWKLVPASAGPSFEVVGTSDVETLRKVLSTTPLGSEWKPRPRIQRASTDPDKTRLAGDFPWLPYPILASE